MNRQTSAEFIELKRRISTYVDKYPTANKEWNDTNLRKLKSMEDDLDDPRVEKEYYKLRDSIVLANGGFAMKYVTRYHNVMTDDTSIVELFQEATLGLIETIDDWDPSKKTTYTTYAHFHIMKRLVDFIKKNKLVKAPRDVARNLKHVNEAQATLLTQTGQWPLSKDIVKYLKKEKKIKLKESLVDDIMILLELNSSGSDDSFISEYKDQMPDSQDTELFRDMELNIMSQISGLGNLAKRCICLRFGIGREYSHSPEEIKLLLELNDSQLEEIK